MPCIIFRVSARDIGIQHWEEGKKLSSYAIPAATPAICLRGRTKNKLNHKKIQFSVHLRPIDSYYGIQTLQLQAQWETLLLKRKGGMIWATVLWEVVCRWNRPNGQRSTSKDYTKHNRKKTPIGARGAPKMTLLGRSMGTLTAKPALSNRRLPWLKKAHRTQAPSFLCVSSCVMKNIHSIHAVPCRIFQVSARDMGQRSATKH